MKITSAEENNFVLALAKQKASSRQQIWIGLQWDSGKRKFIWSDLSVPVYQNWAPGEPNNYAREPCGNMWTGHAGMSGYWNDLGCGVHSSLPCGLVCKRVP